MKGERMHKPGTFTISLDFELYWGMRDKVTWKGYRDHLIGVWEAVPKILTLFEQRGIHATWATVGMLFLPDESLFEANRPAILPQYDDMLLSPFHYFDGVDPEVRRSESFRKTHFAAELIEAIVRVPHQEIATHSYSHCYTREAGFTPAAFDADMEQALKVAAEAGVQLSSLVFPRNQIDLECVESIRSHGIQCYRGNQDHWAYREGEVDKTLWQRAYRLADSYINLSGHHTTLPRVDASGLTEMKSSMFLRPYSPKLHRFEGKKRQRIKRSMQHAALRGENFHLWWHPHNFGVNTAQNLSNLERILDDFELLLQEHGMVSLNMRELGVYYG